MFLLIILAPFISNKLLNNSLTYYPIVAISFTLPFICLSNILKGYFFGKVNMLPYVISNIIEQLVRLLFIIFIIPKMIKYGIVFAVTGVVLINILSEFSSTISLIIFMPNKKINLNDLKFNHDIFKDILNISLTTTGSRLIGSISYFLEPIILTFILLKLGYTNEHIMNEYGIITGYVFPLLLIPSFFTMAISTSLLPIISKSYSLGNIKYTKKKLKQALTLSVSIGIFFTIIFILFPKELLTFIYNTNKGSNYIRVLAPFFIMHYIQSPLTSFLQAVNKSKEAMYGTLVGSIIKNILLLILPIFLNMWGFIIASLINIFYVTIQHIYYTKKSFIK
jgi:stage V sporulation protein B